MLLPFAHEKTELVEVVRITDPMRHLSSEDLVGEDIAIWEAAQARKTLAMVAGLPAGERQRCFMPGWGIRAHGATEHRFQIAFCFRCNGARLWGPGVPAEQQGIHTFAAESPPGLELLLHFRHPKQDSSSA